MCLEDQGRGLSRGTSGVRFAFLGNPSDCWEWGEEGRCEECLCTNTGGHGKGRKWEAVQKGSPG